MSKRHQRRSREQWAIIMDSHAASGLTIADYCQANGIGLASFGKWKRRLRDDTGKPNHSDQKQNGFVPVQLLESQSPVSTVTLSLGANITLTINTSGSIA